MAAPKMTKNQMRRAKKKEQKKVKADVSLIHSASVTRRTILTSMQTQATEQSDVEKRDESPQPTDDSDAKSAADLAKPSAPASEPIRDDLLDDDPVFAAYRDIFNKFGLSFAEDQIAKEANAGNQGDVFFGDNDDIPDEEDENPQPKLSKKKRKQMNKLSVAQLKALVNIPEVVEWQDVSSSDPRLLVQIKAQRNVVPVPSHWAMKREYLSSKRGIEKSAFRLPKFIAETGIAEMRDAVLEKQAEQTLKQKQRERTKPELTRFGEVYYEGKESEVDYQHFRPGELSDATKEALGMPPGAPPPWLINQQRFGTPPSYPTLRIPGLNAPPPAGGSWGFHPGGWGKPPVDEFNRPLYGGDVFGLTAQNGASGQAQVTQPQAPNGDAVERTLWGELQPREEESEEEEEDDEEEESEDDDVPGGTETPSGLETPGGYTSTVHPDYSQQGVETSIAGEMDLRKERRGYDTEESSAPRSAYTVVPERQVRAEGFFGSDRAYDISAAQRSAASGIPVLGADDDTRKRKKPGDVDVAIDVDSLNQQGGLSKDDLRSKYEASNKEEGIGARWAYDDDLSQMIAEESRKRQRTEKEQSERKREGKYKF
ncbi:hypothetical protein TrVFT333_009973 [Trichoderma virens FT-333]|nr:hypothetical protein TrVFT333_009973 [Trichoderma virens FT-333]